MFDWFLSIPVQMSCEIVRTRSERLGEFVGYPVATFDLADRTNIYSEGQRDEPMSGADGGRPVKETQVTVT